MKKIILVSRQLIYILDRPQKILCGLVFAITALGAVFECVGVAAILPLMNVIMDTNLITGSSWGKRIPFLASLSNSELLAFVIICVIALYLIKNIYFILQSWIRVKFACKIKREVSIHIMESYMSCGYSYFLNKSYGELSRGLNVDVSQLYIAINAAFRMISDSMTVALICIFMFLTDWELSLTIAMMAVICVILIYFTFHKGMYKAGLQTRKYAAQSSQAIIQAFEGIKDILFLRKQEHFVEIYEKSQIGAQQAECRVTVGQESPAYIIEGLCVTGFMIVVGTRIALGNNSSTFLSTLAAFAVGAFRILPCLGRISLAINQLNVALPSIGAVYDDICEAEEYSSIHSEMQFKTRQSGGLIAKPQRRVKYTEYVGTQKFQSKLTVRNVTFSYNPDTDNVLENINLEVKKGQSIALIGKSGSGKSTLADILLGLLIPQKGSIYIDDTLITTIPEKWSETIGYVPQSVFLSSGSIKENVAFGEDEEEIDIGRVYEALERAELIPFINSLNLGIETTVGDQGVRLSGGQRQRIAIARALYRRPEILVLDEATSALDNDTEAAIMSAIDALQGKVTLIIVAHRLTTVKKCDVIYEVSNKSIWERNKQEVLEGL